MKEILAMLIIIGCLLANVGICSDMGDPDPRPKGIAPIWYTMEK